MRSKSSIPTHFLECRHCIGKTRRDYAMPCIPLKSMSGGRVKIKVFGDRDWKDTQCSSRIRYVLASRVHAVIGIGK